MSYNNTKSTQRHIKARILKETSLKNSLSHPCISAQSHENALALIRQPGIPIDGRHMSLIFGIGPQFDQYSAIYQALNYHPEIQLGNTIDLNFFTTTVDTHIDIYDFAENLPYPSKSSAHWAVDATPQYSSNPTVPYRIHDSIDPNSLVILFSIVHPLETLLRGFASSSEAKAFLLSSSSSTTSSSSSVSVYDDGSVDQGTNDSEEEKKEINSLSTEIDALVQTFFEWIDPLIEIYEEKTACSARVAVSFIASQQLKQQEGSDSMNSGAGDDTNNGAAFTTENTNVCKARNAVLQHNRILDDTVAAQCIRTLSTVSHHVQREQQLDNDILSTFMYSQYLPRWSTVLEKSKMMCVFREELSQDPEDVFKRIFRLMDIEEDGDIDLWYLSSMVVTSVENKQGMGTHEMMYARLKALLMDDDQEKDRFSENDEYINGFILESPHGKRFDALKHVFNEEMRFAREFCSSLAVYK